MRKALTVYGAAMTLLLVAPALVPLLGGPYELANVRNWQIVANAALLVAAWRSRGTLGVALDEWRAPRWLLPALIGAAFASHLVTAVTHLWSFRINGIDFSTFDTMLWHARQGRLGWSTIYGGNHFAVHPTWILLLFVPLHAVFPTPLLLTVAHALAIGAAIFPLLRLTRRHLPGDAWAVLALLAYTTHATTGTISNHGFHVEVLYLPLGLWLAWAWDERKWIALAVVTALFLAVKEDAGLYVAALGGAGVAFARERRVAGAFLCVVGLVAFAVSVGFVQPAFRGSDAAPTYFTFWGRYGATPLEAALGMARSPHQVVLDVARSGFTKVYGSFLFLPLLAVVPLAAALPAIVLLGTSDNPHMVSYNSYYAAPLLPFVLWGALIGARRARRGVAFLALVIAPLIGGDYQRFPAPRPGLAAEVEEAVAQLGDRPVCVQTILFPHLPYELDARPFTTDCAERHGATVLVAPALDGFPHTDAELRAYVEAQPPERRRTWPSGLTLVY